MARLGPERFPLPLISTQCENTLIQIPTNLTRTVLMNTRFEIIIYSFCFYKGRNCDVEFQGSGLSKEDKMKLLEIAKKNALNVHGGLNKNESISMRAGGKKIIS